MTDHADALRAALSRAAFSSESPRLSDEVFLGIRSTIVEASGIAFDERSRFILERRLLPRLRELRLASFEQYYRYLLYSPDAEAEMGRMLEQVAIRETYFFREPQQFASFREELLPRVARCNGATRRLRVWSAGCASGEEPYTIAMLVRESGLFADWHVEIIGTDLSLAAIGDARRGVFRESSLRIVPDEIKARFFAPEGEGAWRIDERVRAMVTFGPFNLIDAHGYELYSDVDVIFCRNVLIYFGPDTRRLVVNRFHATLGEGGYLLLGHAESLAARTSPFKLVHLQRDLIYQK